MYVLPRIQNDISKLRGFVSINLQMFIFYVYMAAHCWFIFRGQTEYVVFMAMKSGPHKWQMT